MKLEWLDIDIGSEDARVDRDSLPNAFLETRHYKEVARARCNLIIGRKGSGKTAVVLRLKQQYESDGMILIEVFENEVSLLQDFFAELATTTHVSDFKNLGTSYSHIWDAIILSKVVESIRHLESFRKSRWHNDVSGYFKINGDLPFIDYVKQIALGVETKSIKSDSAKIATTVIQEIAKVLSENNTYRKAREGLRKYINSEFDNKIFLFIDDLDRGISNETTKKQKQQLIALCKGLYNALTRLTTTTFSKNLFIKVCMPSDIFEHVRGMRDADKFQPAHSVTLKWSKEELRRMINRRFELVFGISPTKKEDVWVKIMGDKMESYFFSLQSPPGYQVRPRPTFDIVYEYTQSRPRDIIAISRAIFDVAAGKEIQTITHVEIQQGLKRWSESNHVYTLNESSFTDSKIVHKLAVFSNGVQSYIYSKFRKILSRKELALGEKAIDDTIEMFYKVGLIGMGVRRVMASTDDANTTNYEIRFSNEYPHITVKALSAADIIIFHPSLIAPLTLDNRKNQPSIAL